MWLKRLVLVLACLFLAFCQAQKTQPSPDQLEVIAGHILDIFKSNKTLQPTALRLSKHIKVSRRIFHVDNSVSSFIAFHDCVGDCDGCVNLSQEDNKGLETIVEKYEEIIDHPDIEPYMTRGDLWAFGGMIAVQMGVKKANKRWFGKNTESVQDFQSYIRFFSQQPQR